MSFKRNINFLILFVIMLASFGFTIGPEYPHLPGGADQRIDPPINTIAWQDHDFENGAVAYSTHHDQFLVVFERDSGNGDIYGRFINGADGDLLGPYPFRIATSAAWKESNPDVAYDPDADRFMVVYDEGSSTLRHVRGRLIYGSFNSSGDHLASNNVHGIAATGEDEFDPAIAYNLQDSQFLVVFNYSSQAVYGRRLDSGTSKANFIGDAFEIFTRLSSPLLTPDVAWSDGDNDRFLAVFTDYDSANIRNITRGAYIFDTIQPGSQLDGGACWIAPYDAGPYPLTKSTTQPSVAFDPLYESFYVVVEYKESPTKKSIYGHALDPNNDAECLGIFKSDHAFPIENVFDEQNTSHIYPHITYSGIGSFMYVSYVTQDATPSPPNYSRIYLRTVSGVEEEYAVTPRKEVQAGTREESVLHPAAAAGINGKAVVVWQQDDIASGWDILGRFVMPYWRWLPVILAD